MNAATLPAVGLIYAWVYSKISLCEYQAVFLRAAVVGAFIAFLTFALHLLTRKGQEPTKLVATTVLVTFFILRVSAVAAVIFAAGYLRIATASEDAYQSFGIRLQIERGGILVDPPGIVKLQSRQPLTVVGEVRECKNSSVKWAHEPKIGVLNDSEQGVALYQAPERIADPSVLSLLGRSPFHNDTAKIHIQLIGSPTGVLRHPGVDPAYPDTLYDFIVISNTESWLYKNTKKVSSLDHDSNAIDACSVVKRLQSDRLLENYQAIIAIGTASREGSDDDERVRAAERAETLAVCVRDALQQVDPLNMPKIYTLNLGRFQSRSSATREATSQERRAVLMGLITGKRPESEVLKNFSIDALRSANDDSFIRFLAKNYSPKKIELWPSSQR